MVKAEEFSPQVNTGHVKLVRRRVWRELERLRRQSSCSGLEQVETVRKESVADNEITLTRLSNQKCFHVMRHQAWRLGCSAPSSSSKACFPAHLRQCDQHTHFNALRFIRHFSPLSSCSKFFCCRSPPGLAQPHQRRLLRCRLPDRLRRPPGQSQPGAAAGSDLVWRDAVCGGGVHHPGPASREPPTLAAPSP